MVLWLSKVEVTLRSNPGGQGDMLTNGNGWKWMDIVTMAEFSGLAVNLRAYETSVIRLAVTRLDTALFGGFMGAIYMVQTRILFDL